MGSYLIKCFRDKANEEQFYSTHYLNIDGRNLWNCICSAMDWVTIGVENINYYPKLQLIGHNPKTTLNIFILLMQVTMVKEGVKQLRRVFMKTSEIYFIDDQTVWGPDLVAQTANKYFEILRACFGVHPVNQKGVKNNCIESHRFAS